MCFTCPILQSDWSRQIFGAAIQTRNQHKPLGSLSVAAIVFESPLGCYHNLKIHPVVLPFSSCLFLQLCICDCLCSMCAEVLRYVHGSNQKYH